MSVITTKSNTLSQSLGYSEESPRRWKKLSLRNQKADMQKRSDGVAHRRHILVNDNMDLLCRLDMDHNGYLIEFKADDGYTGFTGSIAVNFPPYCILGNEKVSVEVIPAQHLKPYNDLLHENGAYDPKTSLITPIIHIDRQNDVPFLQEIEIFLPIFSKYVLKELNLSEELSFETGKKERVVLKQSKFSPTGVCYDSVQDIVKSFRVDNQFQFSFRDKGVYFLFEQLEGNNAIFDIRQFTDEEEHRVFRMDESKYFRMIINPQYVKDSDYDTIILLEIEDTIKIVNAHQYRNVDGNTIKFVFPNIDCDTDDSNVRRVKMQPPESFTSSVKMTFQFESHTLQQKGIDGAIQVPFLKEEKIKELSGRVLPDKDMLARFLQKLGANWTKFLSDFLKVEIRALKEFIFKDITATLPLTRLRWTRKYKERLKLETQTRNLRFAEGPKSELLTTLFDNFKTSWELLTAKKVIIDCLKCSGVLDKNQSVTEGLLQQNCEVVAYALMYLPLSSLKIAVYSAFQKGFFSIIEGEDAELEKFIFDKMIPAGDNL